MESRFLTLLSISCKSFFFLLQHLIHIEARLNKVFRLLNEVMLYVTDMEAVPSILKTVVLDFLH